MTDLRTAAQQALDDLRDLHANHNITYAGTISRLEAALAQEQPNQTWVCPDSPEHRYKKPGHCEDCGKVLVLAQGCDRCNHPLYAATRCRVCGRVTEQAEPVSVAAAMRDARLNAGWGSPAQPAEPVEPVAWRWGYRSVTTGEMDWRGYVEIAAHPNLRSPEIIMEPLYAAPPQRKPLTDQEIDRIRADCVLTPHEYRDRAYGWALHFARAVERAHGITGDNT